MRWIVIDTLSNYNALGINWQPDENILSLELWKWSIGVWTKYTYHGWKPYGFAMLQATCFYVMGWGLFHL